jgi:hypothetical protein
MDKGQALERAADIVLAVWRRVDKGGMAKSRLYGIYDELNSKIRSAALTSDLVRFTENLGRSFGIRDLADTTLLELVTLLGPDDHRAVLDALRNETSFVVLEVRLKSEEKREAYEQRQRELTETQQTTGGVA